MADLALMKARQRQAKARQAQQAASVAPIPGAVQPPLTAAEEPKGFVRDLGSSVAEGVTLGFSDEISGLIRSAIDSGMSFDQAVEIARMRMSRIPTATRITGNIAGGIATAPLAGLRAPATIAQAARQGAGLGAIAGAGSAEGGLPERALGAGVGATIGAPLAAAGQGAVQGATRAANAARQGLGRPQSQAIGRAATELDLAGTTPQRITAQQQRLGPEALLADVPELQPLAQQTATKTAAGGRIARQALEGRQARAGPRVEAALDVALGGQNLRAVRQGIVNARKADAAPLYEQALSVGPLRRTEALEDLIGENGSSLVRGQIASLKRSNKAFRNMMDEDPRLLHEVRVALAERSKGQGANKRNINAVNQQLTDAMDDAGATGYREAVNQYRSDSLTLEAFDRGRKALTELPEDIAGFLQNAPEGEQGAFVAGLGREAQKRLSTGETGSASRAVRGLLSGEKAQVLRESLGADAFNAFRTRLLRELDFATTKNRVLGGSPTQPRQAAAAEQFRRLGRVQRGVQGIRQGGVASGLAELLTAAERPGANINQERALAQLLFSTGRQGLGNFQQRSPLLALAGRQRLDRQTAPLRAAIPGASGVAGGQGGQALLGLAGF